MSSKSEFIADAVADMIAGGQLEGKLPSETELATRFGTTKMTAGKALNALQERGLIVRIPKSGSYVRQAETRTVRIYPRYYLLPQLLGKLEKLHPGVKFEVVDDIDEADGMVFASTIPFDYGEYFLPWPKARLEKIKAWQRLHPYIFNFHTVRDVCYGIPYQYSPILLAWNKDLMRQVDPEFTSETLTWEKFIGLLRRSEGPGFDFSNFGRTFLLNIIYSLSKSGTLDEALFANAVKMLGEVSNFKFGGGDFAKGTALFMLMSRGNFKNMKLPFEIGITATPEIGGHRTCHSASETLFVSNRARNPELMFDIAESVLSPSIQKTIASGWAFPADASMLNTARLNRQDPFWTETENIIFLNRLMNGEGVVTLSHDSRRLFRGEISHDEFVVNIGKHLRRCQELKRRREYILNEHRLAGVGI